MTDSGSVVSRVRIEESMKVHKVEILIIDFDELGADGVKVELDATRFANDCIRPRVMNITTKDIGEWRDDHPMNSLVTRKAEYDRLFQ